MRWFKNNYARKTEISRHRDAAERLREPSQPPPDPAEELLREWPELQAFGVEWVRKWLDLRERLIEIAKVMRRYPWMVEVVRQRPMSILHPYMVEVYVRTALRRVSRSPRPRLFVPKTALRRRRDWSWSLGGMRYMRIRQERCTAPRGY
jgi:hypothetical protein